jgi:hypothetical protein
LEQLKEIGLSAIKRILLIKIKVELISLFVIGKSGYFPPQGIAKNPEISLTIFRSLCLNKAIKSP